jgi:hypothetical protein
MNVHDGKTTFRRFALLEPARVAEDCVSPNPMAQRPARLKLVGILVKNLPFTIQSAPLTWTVARLRSLFGGQSRGGRGGPGCEKLARHPKIRVLELGFNRLGIKYNII